MISRRNFLKIVGAGATSLAFIDSARAETPQRDLGLEIEVSGWNPKDESNGNLKEALDESSYLGQVRLDEFKTVSRIYSENGRWRVSGNILVDYQDKKVFRFCSESGYSNIFGPRKIADNGVFSYVVESSEKPSKPKGEPLNTKDHTPDDFRQIYKRWENFRTQSYVVMDPKRKTKVTINSNHPNLPHSSSLLYRHGISDDGEVLVAQGYDGFGLFRLDNRESLDNQKPFYASSGDIKALSQGSLVAIVRDPEKNTYSREDMKTGEKTLLWSQSQGRHIDANSFALSPNGRFSACCRWGGFSNFFNVYDASRKTMFGVDPGYRLDRLKHIEDDGTLHTSIGVFKYDRNTYSLLKDLTNQEKANLSRRQLHSMDPNFRINLKVTPIR